MEDATLSMADEGAGDEVRCGMRDVCADSVTVVTAIGMAGREARGAGLARGTDRRDGDPNVLLLGDLRVEGKELEGSETWPDWLWKGNSVDEQAPE